MENSQKIKNRIHIIRDKKNFLNMSLFEARVIEIICKYSNPKKGYTCYPSIRTITYNLAISYHPNKSKIIRTLKSLEEKGFLKITRRFSEFGKKISNLYEILDISQNIDAYKKPKFQSGYQKKTPPENHQDLPVENLCNLQDFAPLPWDAIPIFYRDAKSMYRTPNKELLNNELIEVGAPISVDNSDFSNEKTDFENPTERNIHVASQKNKNSQTAGLEVNSLTSELRFINKRFEVEKEKFLRKNILIEVGPKDYRHDFKHLKFIFNEKNVLSIISKKESEKYWLNKKYSKIIEDILTLMNIKFEIKTKEEFNLEMENVPADSLKERSI